MRVIITEKTIGDWAAVYVAKKILDAKPTAEKPFVLGLPTGGTPLDMYKRLIQFCKDGIISFENIVTFNMDEYVGLSPDNDQSY
ncbi:MAG: glucosamine-6-phosphate deaminase, partial [Cetobacterium sp.]